MEKYIENFAAYLALVIYSLFWAWFGFRVGAAKPTPQGFASSSGSASAASSVQAPPVVDESVANPKPSSMGKEDEALDLSRAVQLPVSGSETTSTEMIDEVVLTVPIVGNRLNIIIACLKPRVKSFSLALKNARKTTTVKTRVSDAPSGAGASGGS